MFDQFKPFAKAVAGFVTPGIIAFLGAITDGSDGGGHVTNNEWSVIGLAMFATGGAVFAVRNSDRVSRAKKRTSHGRS
jgi:hypothetical protein